MLSLFEVIHHADAPYLEYFSKKTGFLAGRYKSSPRKQIGWLWQHLGHVYRQFPVAPGVSKENEILFRSIFPLLDSFGHTKNPSEELKAAEAIIPWLFKHPQGGIFIPLEIIKLLMQEEIFQKENYLFALLFRLNKNKELTALASLVAGSLEGQVHITFEKNPLDMALVLYIWLAGNLSEIASGNSPDPEGGDLLQKKSPGKIIPLTFPPSINSDLPASSSDKSIKNLANGEEEVKSGVKTGVKSEIIPIPGSDQVPQQNKRTKTSGFNWRENLPSQPTGLWDFLETNFPKNQEGIELLRKLLTRGNKRFYRALSLVEHENRELLGLFRNGILFPVLPGSSGSGKSREEIINKIQVVSPRELVNLMGGS